VPTLVLAGAHDEAMPYVRAHVCAESSHLPHVEENAAFTAVVGGFLREHDTR
jgi:hypothetical protein